MNQNKLKLNFSTTNYVIIHKKHSFYEPCIKINDTEIEKVGSVKYLEICFMF